VDFSDRFNLQARSYRTFNNRRKGVPYDEAEELANYDEEDDESVEEKLSRLQREVEQLKSALSSEAQDRTSTDEDHLNEIEKLSETLDSVYLQRNGSRGAEARFSQSVKAFKSAQADDPSRSATTFKQPPIDTETAEALSKAADLDSRLAFVETALGMGQSQLPEASDIDQKPILPVLSTIERVMQLVTAQSTALETAQAKTRTLVKDVERSHRLKQELDAANSTTQSNGEAKTENSDQATKINALYGILPTVESIAPTLPLVLERLRTLRVLHSSAADAQSLLGGIEKRQAEQAEEMQTWRDALEKVESNMNDGETALEENMEKMGGWIRELEARLAKH
jgi:nuclear migration protein JNM1